MILHHFSSADFVFDPSKTYDQLTFEQSSIYSKPQGFWVSVDGEDSWDTWCLANNFGHESTEVSNLVTLKADANIIILYTKDEIRNFAKRFMTVYSETFYLRQGIFWAAVTKEYSGIIIPNYLYWECQDELDIFNWYYGWDVASGCIWDLNAIESVIVDDKVEV